MPATVLCNPTCQTAFKRLGLRREVPDQKLCLLMEMLTRLVGTGGQGETSATRALTTLPGQRDAVGRGRSRRRTSYGSQPRGPRFKSRPATKVRGRIRKC